MEDFESQAKLNITWKERPGFKIQIQLLTLIVCAALQMYVCIIIVILLLL